MTARYQPSLKEALGEIIWDEVREFLNNIGDLKDPGLYSTALEYLERLLDDIHEFDHLKGEPVAHYLGRNSKAYNDIEDFNRKVGERKARTSG